MTTRLPPSWSAMACVMVSGVSFRTTALHSGQIVSPQYVMNRRIWSASSVAVATVDRAFFTEFFCSIAMAGRIPSISSTSGRSMRSRNCRTYVDIDSTNRRCPSAYSVLKASDDFPDPDGPVRTVSWRCGISTETFLRLCVRAPRMEIVRVGIRMENAAKAGCHPRAEDFVNEPTRSILQPSNPDVMPLVKVVIPQPVAQLLDHVLRQPGVAGGHVGLHLPHVLCSGDGGGHGVVGQDEAEGAFDQRTGCAADDRLHLVNAAERFLQP